MKKILSFILSILMATVFMVSVSAAEFNGADLFTVDIPEDFEQIGTAVSDFNFTDEDGNSFSVSYSDNAQAEKPFIVKNMTKGDIEKYVATITDDAKSAVEGFFDEFDVKATYYGKEKINNGMTALVITLETTAKSGDKTHTYYQKMCELSGADNKYTFTYTTSDNASQDAFDEVFKGIDLFEGEARGYIDNVGVYLAGAFILGFMVFCIIKFMRRK